ncbi:hypothetical protein AMJ80_10350 [bacterium SM23_31]|nr:MAG: hypothetical protein AMJ80_10350 [bacterium SM23_31]
MTEIEAKEKYFTEIRQTIKFMLREREQGRELFKISDFFRKELEDEIVNNFGNMINRQEYEETVLELFGAKRSKKVKITKMLVYKEVENLIRKYRLRSRKEIFQKLIAKLQPLPLEYELLRDFVIESYNYLIRETLLYRISSMVREGTTDLRKVMSAIRLENFDVDRNEIKRLLDKCIEDLEKLKKKYKREPKRGKIELTYPAEVVSPVKQRLKENMRKSLIHKAQFKKQRFIKNECPKFKFALVENKIENDMRVLVHSGEVESGVIRVKTMLFNNRVTDVQIACLKIGSTRGVMVSVAEFQKTVAVKQTDASLQRWLKSANNQMGFPNIQTLNWFLMSVLNDRFKLPEGVSNYLKGRFVIHLINLDKNLTKYIVEKALEEK